MAHQDLCVKVIYNRKLNLSLLPPLMIKCIDIKELREFDEIKHFIKQFTIWIMTQ
jgi:hypothetical protein